MDRTSASEALDMGSIPVGGANSPLVVNTGVPASFNFVTMLTRLLALITLGLCLLAGSAQAAPVLEMAVLEHGVGIDTIASVASADAARFQALPNEFFGGYSRQPHWLRFTLNAPVGEWWLSLLPPFVDDLRLYVPDPDHPGAFLERRSGDHLPFTQREEDYRGFVFKLKKAQAAPLVLYLRMETTSTSRLMARINSPETFHAAMAVEYNLLMGILGATLGVLLISLNSWLWLREDLSFWSVAYLVNLVFTFAAQDGFITQYLLPSSPIAGDAMVSVAGLSAFGVGSAFFRRLFEIGPEQRVVSGIYRCATWWPLPALLALAAGFVTEVMFTQAVMLVAMMPLSVWLSYRLWRKRNPVGSMLLTVNLMGVAAALSLGLSLTGLVQLELIAGYATQVIALGTGIVLHLVIGVRLREMRKQAELTQKMAMRLRLLREKAELTQKRADLQSQTLRQQTEFFAMLSHELKTPLAMIDGSVQSLELLTPQHPAIERRYERIRRAVARINDLLQKFLVHSHLDRRNPPLRKQTLMLDALVAETVAGFAEASGRISLDLEPQVQLDGDETLLKIMISNLIDNALKYSPPDSVVSVSLHCAGDEALLQVADRGPGVAPAMRERLFESYVRGETVGDIPGAGLGLHLVRKIVRLHGGEAHLLDTRLHNAGTGATFRISLKLQPETA